MALDECGYLLEGEPRTETELSPAPGRKNATFKYYHALLRRLKELRRDTIYAAYEEAAQDPVYMQDMHFDVVTVVPMTRRGGKKRRVYPFEVLAPDLVGTGHESIVMPQQVRTISKRRLLERAGVLQDEAIQIDVEHRLLEHLGIDFEAQDL